MEENKELNQETNQVSNNSPKTEKAPENNESFGNLKSIQDIPVTVSAVLGNAKISIGHLLKVGRGAVIELDQRVGEPINIYVNSKVVAKGEVVVLEGGQLGLTITEILKSDERL